eukprot:6375272-Pyramimonas_sp.AAC.1
MVLLPARPPIGVPSVAEGAATVGGYAPVSAIQVGKRSDASSRPCLVGTRLAPRDPRQVAL